MIHDALTIPRAYWPVWVPLAVAFVWWMGHEIVNAPVVPDEQGGEEDEEL